MAATGCFGRKENYVGIKRMGLHCPRKKGMFSQALHFSIIGFVY